MTTFKDHSDATATRSKLSLPKSSRSRRRRVPLRFTAYDGSAAGPEDSEFGLDTDAARHQLPGDRARRSRLARAYISGDMTARRAPRRSLRAPRGARRQAGLQSPAGAGAGQHRPLDRLERLKPIAPPPQETLPRWRRIAEGLRHSKTRDAEAIHHHYDVSNKFYE